MIDRRRAALWILAAFAGAAFLFAMMPPRKVDEPRPTEQPARQSAGLLDPCASMRFEQSDFIVCTSDLKRHKVSLHLQDETGKPWKELKRFAEAQKPVFAMNAGMYHEDLSPVGLYVENGRQFVPLNTSAGAGNFFMQPNGVFGVTTDGMPFVVRSEAYALSKVAVSFATQSGPMLVIDGAVHPKFEPDGASRNIRNGVGIDDEGRAVFAISKDVVSFGKFARLFRDQLKCRNALYFDGVVSAFSSGNSLVQGGTYPSGPIVAVFDQPTPATQ